MLPKAQPWKCGGRASVFLVGLRAKGALFLPVVLKEILLASEADSAQIMEVLERLGPALLDVTPEAEDLAQHYIDCAILPAKKHDVMRYMLLSPPYTR